ncbi:MAG TPA: PAS domain S-box protein, partial [Ardenticatenaceae bacterium]
MNPTYQLLLDCFNQVALDPGTIPQVPLGHFPDDSDERQLFDAFQTMLERVGESRQQLREQYEELVNSINGIVWEADAQTVEFSFVSQQAERLLGYPTTRWVDEPTFWQDHMHPEDRDWAVPFCAIATEEMRPHQFEYRMFADDGRTVWLRDIVSVGIENNQPVRLRGVMIDITEQKQAQEAIEQLRRQNELILNSAGEGIYGIDRDGRTTFVNPAAARMLGWDQEELIGRLLHDLVHHTRPDGSPYPREECPILDTIKDGISRSVDTERFWRKDGTSLPVEYISTPIWEAGEVVGAVITFQDITERVRAQDALR